MTILSQLPLLLTITKMEKNCSDLNERKKMKIVES